MSFRSPGPVLTLRTEKADMFTFVLHIISPLHKDVMQNLSFQIGCEGCRRVKPGLVERCKPFIRCVQAVYSS